MKRRNQTPRVSPRQAEAIERKFAAQAEAHKVVATCFGDGPSIDFVIMRQLRAALSSVDHDLNDALFQRSLISERLSAALSIIKFIAFALPLARSAQLRTGVPSSVLLCELYRTSRWVACETAEGNDIFGAGKKFDFAQDAFIEYAKKLKRDPAFAAVMHAFYETPEAYLSAVRSWSISKHGHSSAEFLQALEDYGFGECDRLRDPGGSIF